MISGNTKRIGNFTSSEIYLLTKLARDGKSFGAPALSYIERKVRERKLGRTINNDSSARSTSWGNLVEKILLNEILSTSYRTCSQETIDHNIIPTWKGSPDAERFVKGEKYAVVDIKCPYTLTSFCEFVDSFERGGITEFRAEHPDGEKYYWQLVSNAILLEVTRAELIVYCPYLHELEAIKDYVYTYDGADQYKYFWIHSANNEELPHILPDRYYKNLYNFEFEISIEDKFYLIDKVIEASQLLTQHETQQITQNETQSNV